MIDAGITANLLSQNSGRGIGDATRTAELLFGQSKKMKPEAAEKAAKDFESMFVSQMLEQMFGDSLGDDLFGDSDTNEVYKGLMMDEYGKMISKSGGIGIADYVKRELLKLQEI